MMHQAVTVSLTEWLAVAVLGFAGWMLGWIN
jgi:hypothetical protein